MGDHENEGDEIVYEGDEIEQHLVKKVRDAISKLVEQQNLMIKYFSFKDDFDHLLENIITRKTTQDAKVDWHIERRNNLYALNNLVTEWQIIIKNQKTLSHKEMYDCCKEIKKSMTKMKKEISGEESSSRGDHDGSVSHHQQPNHPIYERNKNQVYRWSSRHAPRKVLGLDNKILEMERDVVLQNVNDSFKVYGVVGVAGIGKTTLCQAFFRLNSVKQRFSPRIWVCLSKQEHGRQDYREEIVVRMLKCLGIDDQVIDNAAGKNDVCRLKRLILLLRLQLIGKRYLIVLDDAWNEDKSVTPFFSNLNQKEQMDENWGEELAYGLPKGRGGAVVSSSTSDALLKTMLGNDVSLQYLQPQTDEIISEIFKDAVTGYGEDAKELPQHLEDLKAKWLKKCDGIPLAAKLLATIARESSNIKA
ncbi:hypothetical protein QVD17_21441 [Tagetes erecta]|uniref:NB-ARC domain-containing protein n=1 Tax=Tagetes erecta TaxID=13708 RepID=A0AAD8NTJ1_TARER|nr:hypothetical protein QVD17_21441 [Tagetes erecta]